MKFLHPSNWSRLGKKYQKGQIEYVYQKPRVLLSQMSIVGILLTTPHLILDIVVNQDQTAAFLDATTVVLLILTYVYNEIGKWEFARGVLFIFLNIILFLFANLLPVERGVYMIFFALIAFTFPMFSTDRMYLRVFVAIPIVLLLITLGLNFNAFEIPKTSEPYFITFVINVVITAVSMIFSFAFLIHMNDEAKDILSNLIEGWNIKNTELEKANSELDRFVYSTSHELRSPLLSIQGLVDLAEREQDAEQKNKYLQLIQKSVHKQDEFITEILQYSRNTRIEVSEQTFDIRAMLDAVVAECATLENGSAINFRLSCEAEQIRTDEARVEAILKNLISNAVKYSDKGKERFINITAKVSGNILNVEIEDNGIGIPETYQGRIYEMFFRATNQSTGSGLGLYIVREMIDKLAGSIQFESVAGEGTKFVITIPLSS